MGFSLQCHPIGRVMTVFTSLCIKCAPYPIVLHLMEFCAPCICVVFMSKSVSKLHSICIRKKKEKNLLFFFEACLRMCMYVLVFVFEANPVVDLIIKGIQRLDISQYLEELVIMFLVKHHL